MRREDDSVGRSFAIAQEDNLFLNTVKNSLRIMSYYCGSFECNAILKLR